MTFELLPSLGAAVTALLGAMGLLAPATVMPLVGLTPDAQDAGLLGQSEIRATYGGFFLSLGVVLLALQSSPAFIAAGAAWLGAALARLISVFIDSSRSAKNLGGILFESAIGLLLLSSTLTGAPA